MAGFESDEQVLRETDDVQRKTKDALHRIQQQTAQAEELGGNTLAALREQRDQMDKIQGDGDDLNAKLEKSKKLQDSFDRWAGNWTGRKKRSAKKEAGERVEAAERDRQLKLRDVGREDGSAPSPTASETDKKIKKKKKGKKAKSRGTGGPPPRTDLVTVDRNDPNFQQLDHETQAGLEKIADNDRELDEMLDATASSLDQLNLLSKQIQEETELQNKKIGNIEKTLDKGHAKQSFVTARAKRFVKGKFRNTPGSS